MQCPLFDDYWKTSLEHLSEQSQVPLIPVNTSEIGCTQNSEAIFNKGWEFFLGWL